MMRWAASRPRTGSADEGDQHHDPGAVLLDHAHGEQRRADHDALRDDDGDARRNRRDRPAWRRRRPCRRAAASRHCRDGKQASAAARTSSGLHSRENHEAARLAGVLRAVLQPARRPVVDRVARDHQHRDDRGDAEGRGEPEHGGQAEFPAEQPDRPAPTMLPAWLKAWLRPFCRAKPAWRTMPSVMPLTAGPIAAPATAVATCEAATSPELLREAGRSSRRGRCRSRER